MAEKLDIYDLEGNLLRVEDRKKYFIESKEEFEKTGKVSSRVKSIRLLLLNTDGRIYLQKRSRIKPENPGLYDKTVGGHLSSGGHWEITVVRECAEELGIPVAVISDEDFSKAVKSTNLEVIGLVKKLLGPADLDSERTSIDGKKFIQPYITCYYIGYYNGVLKFVDGESCGIEVFSMDELLHEIDKNPDSFTPDLKFMIERFKDELKPL
ncbi:MAG: NUDIX domain-containing protein [Patescibacteria group bacterium]|jgi:isopentenyldiphosphate isomerase